ncbi:translocation/assembly module TamB [bacterium]|nr:translocation/assembly module TamB [bacterium]
MKLMFRKFINITSITTAILFLLIFTLLFVCTLPIGEGFLKEIVSSQLSSRLDQKIKIGYLETNLLNRVVVGDIKIATQEDGSNHNLGSVKEISVHYQILSFVQGQFVVDSLRVNELNLKAVRDESGRFNLSLPAGKKKNSKVKEKPVKLPVFLRIASLKNSTITYYDQQSVAKYSLENVALSITQTAGNAFEVEIEMDTLKAFRKNLNLVATNSRLAGRYNFESLNLTSLRLSFPGVDLLAEGKVESLGQQATIDAEVRISGNTQDLNQLYSLQIPEKLSPEKGFLEGTVRASGFLKNPEIEYSVSGDNLKFSKTYLKKLQIEGSYFNKQLNLDTLTIHGFGGTAIGAGFLSLDSLKNFNIKAEVADVNAVEIKQFLKKNIPIDQGKIDATLSAKGEMSDWTKIALTGKLKSRNLVVQGKKLKELKVDIRGNGEAWSAGFNYEKSSLRSMLHISENTLAGDYTLEIAELSHLAMLLGIENLEGELSSKGSISGTASAPEFSSDVHGKHIKYSGIPVDILNGKLSYRSKKFEYIIDEAQGSGSWDRNSMPMIDIPLSLGKYDYQLSGQGSFSKPYLAFNTQFDDFTYSLSDSINFTLDKGSIRGILESKTIKLLNFSAIKDSQLITLNGDLDFSKKISLARLSILTRADVDDLKDIDDSPGVINASSTVVPQARIGIDYSNINNMKVNFNSDGLEIERVISFLPYKLPKLAGKLNSSIQFSGSSKYPNLKMQSSVTPFATNRVLFDSLKVSGELNEQFVRINDLVAHRKGFNNTMRGSVEFVRDSTGSLMVSDKSKIAGRVSGKELSLSLLKPLFSDSTIIEGESNYDLILSGTRSKPRINGKLIATNGIFQFHPGSPRISDIQVNVTLKDSLLQIRKLDVTILNRKLKARGSVIAEAWNDFQTGMIVTLDKDTIFYSEGMISRENLDLTLEMENLDLSIFKPLAPKLVRLNGRLNAGISIQGTPQYPDITGNLNVDSLTLMPAALKTPLRNGKIRVSFDRNKVKLDTLIASLENGKIGGKGELSLIDNKINDYSALLSFNNASIKDVDNYELTIGKGRVSINKKDAGMILDGEVRLGQTKVTKDIDVAFLRSQLNKVQRPSLDKPSVLDKISLNVRVHDSDRVGIENNLAEIQLLTDFVVKGTMSKPIVTGRVEVVKGEVYYLDREFRVTTGILDFVDPNRINPIIELTAETTVKSYFALEATEYHITLTISGPADDARIELFSEPELDKSNIVSLLTVGATRDQLTGATGIGTSTILQERAEMLASQKISNYVGVKLSDKIGLDHVAVKGNLFNLNRDSGAQLEATKKVSEQLQLTYITRVGYLDENGLRLTYSLNKYFALQGETHQTGDAGIDLRYNLKFK